MKMYKGYLIVSALVLSASCIQSMELGRDVSPEVPVYLADRISNLWNNTKNYFKNNEIKVTQDQNGESHVTIEPTKAAPVEPTPVIPQKTTLTISNGASHRSKILSLLAFAGLGYVAYKFFIQPHVIPYVKGKLAKRNTAIIENNEIELTTPLPEVVVVQDTFEQQVL